MSSINDKWTDLVIQKQEEIENGLAGYLEDDKRCKTLHVIGFLDEEQLQSLVATTVEDRGNFVWGIMYNKEADEDLKVLRKFALALEKSTPDISKMLTKFILSCSQPNEQGSSSRATATATGNGKIGMVVSGSVQGSTISVDQSETKTTYKTKSASTTPAKIFESLSYIKNHPEQFQQWAFLCPPTLGIGRGTFEPASSQRFEAICDGPSLSKPHKQGKGLTLFINNKFNKYQEPIKRVGAAKDTEKIETTFRKLTDGEVIVEEDVASEEALINVLNDFKIKVLAQKPAYIVVIIGSHGYNNHEILLDDASLSVDLFRDIVYPLSHEYAGFEEYGEDNPRLFFVNACQIDPDCLTGMGIAQRRSGHDGLEPEIPVSATNFFIGFSTLPCHYSYRSVWTGSLYLQAVCRHLKKGEKLFPKLKIIGEEIKKQKTKTPQTSSFLPSYDFPIFDFKF